MRIIFKDFEDSNWSWDPVAGAYFWHRFYSHQPDLNFDNPRVQDALLKATDFWLEAGVDGLRLDAIPYLYEREGTNSENLPETHAFLKKLRRHMDERFADRMLLAEANQWPEDSVDYFGDGDECHMAFHFPLMPRMFMALRMEDRFPVLDILAQTPDIPANSQWALFLRNHDELTLEMVTDEERDYMYRVSAADPQARINLGIRRRLAPLLGNNRRRIELMYGFLFSLPGTPVIYYGDEIGMGDNVYLGDRNGVRTPMQWSSDRNAGFSAANRQRLYLPVVTDPEYHYEAINVEAQQSNPHSLLWWMKRIIALRKQHPAFGRGSLAFLHPENRRILAFIRELDGETLLVVANLSRYAQWTELPLEEYAGRVPVELFGTVEFPRISSDPYHISLGPHSFLWFRLTADTLTPAFSAAGRADIPSLAWRGDLLGLLKREPKTVASVLLRWMESRRWYRGKAHSVRSAAIVDSLPVSTSKSPAALVLLRVDYRDSEPETYALPLIADQGLDAERIVAEAPHALVAWLESDDGSQVRLLDGTLVPEVGEALLGVVATRRRLRGSHLEIAGQSGRALRRRGAPPPETLAASPLRTEQSNSSMVFGESLVMKLYRTIEDGPNPDLDVGGYLTENGFTHVPPVLGSIVIGRPGKADATLAMVQAFIPNEGNLWDATRDTVEAYLQDAEAETEMPDLARDGESFLLDLSRQEPPPAAHRLIGASMQAARVLGERIGQMHLVLGAADPADRDFAPEPLAPFHVRSLYQAIRTSVRDSLALLDQRQGGLSEIDRTAAAEVLSATDAADRHLRRLLDTRIGGQRMRVHGDLHLGQVLDTGSDVMIIDFEGEPARPMSERRLKRPALTDLAGMLRSYHYAAHWPRLERMQLAGRPGEARDLAIWSSFWYQWVAASCVAGYREVTQGAAFLPQDDEGWSVLLDALLISKAAYELRYELGSRPQWAGIPLVAFRGLVAER
ncbi:maltose alpha-D-glucosyltransferase [soil metagenome]